MPRRICRQAPSHLVGGVQEGFFPFSFIRFWILARFLFVLICQNSLGFQNKTLEISVFLARKFKIIWILEGLFLVAKIRPFNSWLLPGFKTKNSGNLNFWSENSEAFEFWRVLRLIWFAKICPLLTKICSVWNVEVWGVRWYELLNVEILKLGEKNLISENSFLARKFKWEKTNCNLS